jgi:hypothetical protein
MKVVDILPLPDGRRFEIGPRLDVIPFARGERLDLTLLPEVIARGNSLAAPVRTNFSAATHVTVGPAASVVLARPAQRTAEGKVILLVVSPALVDATGRRLN